LYCNLSVHLIFYRTGKYRHGVLQRSVWAHCCSKCILIITNKVFHTILFADDTNILVFFFQYLTELISKLNSVLCGISKWFQNNQLVLKLNKIHIVKFASPKLLNYPLHTACNNRALTITVLVEGFIHLDILTVPCLYTDALMLVVKNLNIYQTKPSVHSIQTRQQNKLHIPSVLLSSIWRGVYHSSIKIFNQFPQNVFKFNNNIRTFKTLIRDYLLKNFIPMGEFLSTGNNDVCKQSHSTCFVIV
jgi:hypothetical protein